MPQSRSAGVASSTECLCWVVVFPDVSGGVATESLGGEVSNKEVGLAMRTTPASAIKEASCSLRVNGVLMARWQM